MVPFNAWGQNLRNKLFISATEWDLLRRETYQRANKRCEVCWGQGKSHPVECHEQWHFNVKDAVQTLRGLVALCPTCHAATHYGFSTRHNPEMNDDFLRYHLAVTNVWTLAEVDLHIEEAYAICQGLGDMDWSLNLTLLEREYSDLLTVSTLEKMESLHAGKNYHAGLVPTHVPQPPRDGKRSSQRIRSTLQAELTALGKVPPRVRRQYITAVRPCNSPRIPGTRAQPSWSRYWVKQHDCANVLVALLGLSVPGGDTKSILDGHSWPQGVPMNDLRQQAIAWVLEPLLKNNAGNAAGFLSALDASPLLPIVQQDKRGDLDLAYGLKAEMHWKVCPDDWAQLPAAKALHWKAVASAIDFDVHDHEDRLQLWSERYQEVYFGQIVRLCEIDVDD